VVFRCVSQVGSGYALRASVAGGLPQCVRLRGGCGAVPLGRVPALTHGVEHNATQAHFVPPGDTRVAFLGIVEREQV
jgi:hypothetical protein